MDSTALFPLIEVIATGNELLDGTISDTNTQRFALKLRPLGLKIRRSSVVTDDPAEISRALALAVSRSDVVIVSGGLGPTTDDLTLAVAAKTFGSKMISSVQARRNVLNRIKRLKRKFNAGHEKQSMIPQGADVLANDEGTAPAISWKLGDRRMFFLPGVPREFDHVMDRHLMPFFNRMKAPTANFLFVLKIFGVPESELNEWARRQKLPKGVSVGFRTRLPENHLKFEVTARNEAAARRLIAPLVAKVRKQFGSLFFSMGEESFEEVILAQLLKQKKQIAIAESCTGGLVSSMLTSVSGASAVLNRSFVVYSNQSKMDLLGVKEETLKKHGAVSEQTAREMALGAMKRSGVDKAVSITGIAGPLGGTKQKPVGTVWLAVATRKGIRSQLLQLGFGNRDLIQKFSAYQALRLLAEA